MRIALYLDEDSHDLSLVAALRARGTDVLTAHDAGLIEVPDEEHLEWATQHGRALYSFNVRDFYRLHTQFLSQGRNHTGIVLARQQRYSVGEQMRRLQKLLACRSAEQMCNQIEFLSAWS